MGNRIDISGIDTSTLPKLKHEEQMALLKRAQDGDEQAADEFVMANLRLVLSVTQRFNVKKECLDDMFQVGCIGLMKAMKNFNISYNLRFSTYAVPMIIGEIRRYMRDNSAVRVSRSLRDTAYKALHARQQIETESNREASLEEIAAVLNIPLSDVVFALDAISDPVSLFDPAYHDDSETALVMDQIADERVNQDKTISYIAMDEAKKRLTDREQRILELRFFEGKTQIEVSQEVGISQAQVSRLEKNAIEQLKKEL